MSIETNALILHHYELSPYCRKIRTLLGYVDLPWQSVTIDAVPPRPKLLPLTGGYRKTPVLQIGADVFCDTHTMVYEIAGVAARDELLPESLSDEALALMQKAEDELFLACGIAGMSGRMLATMFLSLSPVGFFRLVKDRLVMGKNSSISAPGVRESREMLGQHVQELEQRLRQDFLFGDTPGLADFAVYPALLMARNGKRALFRGYPKTLAWLERMENFGTGQPVAMSADDALTVAFNSQPRPIASEYQTGVSIGQRVEIAPTDYAKDSTQGILVGKTAYSWIIAREHEAVGQVHVHFPQRGYALTDIIE